MVKNKTFQPGDKSDFNDPHTGQITMSRALQIAASDGRRAISLSRRDWEQAEEELSTEAEQCANLAANKSMHGEPQRESEEKGR